MTSQTLGSAAFERHAPEARLRPFARVLVDVRRLEQPQPVRRAALDIRWAAKEELAALIESDVDALAYSRKVRHWHRRFREEGYSSDDLHEVIRQAEEEAQA